MHLPSLPTELPTVSKDMTVQELTSSEAVKSEDVAFNLLDEFERIKSDDKQLQALDAQNALLRSQVDHLGSQLNWMTARHAAEKDKLLEENAALADTILTLRREIDVLEGNGKLGKFHNDGYPGEPGQRLSTTPAEVSSRSRERTGFFSRKLDYYYPELRRRSSQVGLATSDDYYRQHGSVITTADHLVHYGSSVMTSDRLVHHGSSVLTSDRLHHHSSSVLTSDRLHHHSSSVLTDDIPSHHGSSVLIGAKTARRWPASSDMQPGR